MPYVYLITPKIINEDNNVVKIGRSEKPEKRLKDMQQFNSVELEVAAKFRVHDAPKLEKGLKNFYNKKWIRSELFNFTKKDIGNFLKNCEKILLS